MINRVRFSRPVVILLAILFANTSLADVALNAKLIYTAAFGRSDDVRILLSKGADANSVNNKGWPALSIAADRKPDSETIAIATLLLEAGADVNKGDADGNYPIINAVRNNNSELVKLFLEKGANLDLKNSKGETPLSIATSMKHTGIIEQIKRQVEINQEKDRQERSSENRLRLARELAFFACVEGYNEYAKKYDRPAVIADASEQKEAIVKKMTSLFPMQQKDINAITHISRRKIEEELGWKGEGLFREGFGTEADLEKRCRKIANTWRTGGK